MPDIVRFYFRHIATGFALAIAFVAALLYFDVANLASLIDRSESGWLAIGLLTFFLGLTFGSAQVAFAVLSASDPEDKEEP